MGTKQYALIFIMLFSSCYLVAQIKYEKGYYVDNSGKKIEGFIKNVDGRKNPTEFEFRTTVDDVTKVLTINSVSEFAVENGAKYIRFLTKIDRSSSDIRFLSNNRDPLFKEQTVFLRLLIEGEYNLFEYAEENLRRFFFQYRSVLEPLVYKEYRIGEKQIKVNNFFQQQIKLINSCEQITEKRLRFLDYGRGDLKKLFIELNLCSGSEFNEIERRKLKFNFYAKAGLSSNESEYGLDLISGSSLVYRSTLYGYRLGVEVEFVLPFNKDKWSTVFDPNFQTFSNEENQFEDVRVVVDYAAIELPVGIRHYLYVNDSSKFFLEGFINFNIDLTNSSTAEGRASVDFTTVDFSLLDLSPLTKSYLNFSIGGGFNYKGFLSLGIRIEDWQQLVLTQRTYSVLQSTHFLVGFRF